MRRPRSRVLAAAVAALILFVVLLLLVGRSPGRDDRLRVSLRPDPAVVAPGGRAVILASISEGDEAVDPAGCTLTWTTVGGQVVGSGARAEWFAPSAGGKLGKIAVDVSCGERAGQGHLDVPVAVRGEVANADEPEAEAGGDKAPEGAPYQPVPDGPAPVIDEVIVEKKELCRGEDTLVTVKAHDPAGRDDAWLGYNVGATAGETVPLVYVAQDTGVPQQVAVYGRDNKTFTTAPIPEVRVKDCVVPRQVQVTWTMVTNREDELHVRAKVVPRGDTGPFTPVSFAWDFGDGTSATTDQPFVDHSYLRRPQDRLNSTFLIQVHITSREGDAALGRAALVMRNHYFTQRAVKGLAGLVIQLEPRLPQLGADGVVAQRAFIWHHEPRPVAMTSVTQQEYTRTGEELGVVTVPVASFLGDTEIPPDGITVAVSIDTRDQPDVLMRRYVLEGKTADDVRVFGSFTVMVPPTLARGEGEPVTDERMKQRILLAQKLLGKQVVTEEEMAGLEERGLLPPREPEPAAPPAPKPWVNGPGQPEPK